MSRAMPPDAIPEPSPVRARVIVVACVDVRFVDALVDWLRAQGLRGAYALAGEPNTREHHVVRLKMAQARVQARLAKPTRVFFHPLGPDGRGAPAPEEVGP